MNCFTMNRKKEAYATQDPTNTDVKSQEGRSKEAIKEFKSIG